MYRQKLYGCCPECQGPADTLDSTVKMASCVYCPTVFKVEASGCKSLGNWKLADSESHLYPLATGRFEDREFTVTGRLRFSSGEAFYDRWALYFADADEYHWFLEKEGDFFLLLETAKAETVPEFPKLSVGSRFEIAGNIVSVEEISQFSLTGAEGCLPVLLALNTAESKVDASFGDFSISITYRSGEEPLVAIEKQISEDNLELDVLREELDDEESDL